LDLLGFFVFKRFPKIVYLQRVLPSTRDYEGSQFIYHHPTFRTKTISFLFILSTLCCLFYKSYRILSKPRIADNRQYILVDYLLFYYSVFEHNPLDNKQFDTGFRQVVKSNYNL
jgi:hypothetical protein